MKIITCYKCVPDEQDIAINNADGTLDFSKADGKISQYDLNAIELVFPTADMHRYVIEVSSDNQSWITVSDQRTSNKKEKKQRIDGDLGKNIRFVRINFVSGNAGLAEVKVGGKPTI